MRFLTGRSFLVEHSHGSYKSNVRFLCQCIFFLIRYVYTDANQVMIVTNIFETILGCQQRLVFSNPNFTR